jgi:acyl-CoA thioesterase
MAPEMDKLTPLSELIARRHAIADAVQFPLTPDWQQGRTCYGGLISMLAVVAMRNVAGPALPAEARLRGLQTCFVAPVSPGEVRVDVRLLRQGRNVCQVQAQALQGGQVAAVMIGVFGADRPSGLQVHVPPRPAPRHEAEALPPPPARPSTAPAFLRHFDMRWDEGPPPYSGGQGWRTRIHLRLAGSEAAALSPELQTVLLADLPPTPAIGQLTRPGANSSVSWALEPRPLPAQPAEGWWRADNESLRVEGGYVNHRSELWAPDGRLAAYGSQVVAVFG